MLADSGVLDPALKWLVLASSGARRVAALQEKDSNSGGNAFDRFWQVEELPEEERPKAGRRSLTPRRAQSEFRDLLHGANIVKLHVAQVLGLQVLLYVDLVVGRQNHMGKTAAFGRENLFLDSSDRQYKARERHFSGHPVTWLHAAGRKGGK